MDPVRIKHTKEIADLIMAYTDETGHLPFEEEAKTKPFMVLIGHSAEEEDNFAHAEVLKRGATFANASVLEAKLSEGLGQKIRLPRDPQTVTTFAPNVYVYFVSGNQFSVVSHLFSPSEKSVKYQWPNGTFHSYTITYEKPKR